MRDLYYVIDARTTALIGKAATLEDAEFIASTYVSEVPSNIFIAEIDFPELGEVWKSPAKWGYHVYPYKAK
jgi:hypothetical protein